MCADPARPPETVLRVALFVLYTEKMTECRAFYEQLGLRFETEKHGSGPEHFAAVFPDGCVFEIYPATAGKVTGAVRLGFAGSGASLTPPLDPGRHLLKDPDGRTVEISAK
ncbi:glyoxalase/bleomycin resistance/dioxygenase family protein [Sphaerisporangium perillae]|uniref:glyoxalase/bleomycin resistance/dioxygenase family protein n=1 Tax=Sphaerisporangium perillae TaxID=2935860 RepID=UPI00200F7C85|nr:glyoxalase/bleomycin resistance/dioxygenase family protein [Sphaerisporangium perillae]